MSDFEDENHLEESTGEGGLFEPLVTVPNQTAQRDQMAELHQLICLALSSRIRSGMWSSGDIAAATKFLKDNNITADVGDNTALQDLRDSLAKKQKARRDANANRALTPDELAKIAMEEVNRDVWH